MKTSPRRSIAALFAPLAGLSGVTVDALGPFDVRGEPYSLPRFSFSGPGGADPIRIGLFACLHGDEPAGAHALVRLLSELARDSADAEGYILECYPLCNPTGYEDNTRLSRRGRDLNREFWKGSLESEVRLLQQALLTGHYQGIIQLHADDTSDGLYGYVRGATLTEHLLRPALREAGRILPVNRAERIDGFAARDGVLREHFDGVLAPPDRSGPSPFDIVFETPALATLELQAEAMVMALRTILAEYRRLIAFAADI